MVTDMGNIKAVIAGASENIDFTNNQKAMSQQIQYNEIVAKSFIISPLAMGGMLNSFFRILKYKCEVNLRNQSENIKALRPTSRVAKSDTDPKERMGPATRMMD
jgi:hypothetical protein